MKKITVSFFLLFFIAITQAFPQSNPVMNIFPEGTILHGNIPYNNDNLQKHLLDIYLPPNAKGKLPLVIFVHGGGWLSNDKYADMGYMKKTVAEIVSSGFALASIDYRFSTQAIFPAQIQDCNRAVSFLYDNAEKYGLDKNRFALMGFSAGGHLASLMGLSKNNNVDSFYMPGTSKSFSFKAVVDFYGPAELILFPGADNAKSPEGLLIGAAPLARPDLAKAASPVSYVDKDDPPFLIIHGEKDELVSPRHSQLLSAWLTTEGVDNELIIVKDAPHFGEMFDVDELRNKVISFLKAQLK
ncbi:alpha/beta hydrolase [Catalinimonas niigatensis]|uniref:alpha/beta hydrolase n=1 Tax=Catalinimonas niigatensis TaxID=1397264 RepID=UPI00266589FD|nr:alpha/beta hydrolase [Catalinimonas niigatensis]WPP49151.1 alpha/beta hydrolase [Catalinimonas niigatensis]